LNGTLGFLLHHDRSCGNAVAMRDIPNPQLDQVARSQLAIDGQIEQRQVSAVVGKLQSNPDSPDVLELERCLLTDELAFVPRFAVYRIANELFHDRFLSFEKGTSVCTAMEGAVSDP
jgi:hypothetical protein